ncbi:MAG: hypothetical protein Q4C99_10805, partial [Clostridia bacterium]|nr:hypothetical protein [Clostridia bacterium]
IYYLVGWQYLGHDDKYPDFFEVNEALKSKQDKAAIDSFKRLSDEAKQYHSIVSVHINFNDAYDNAPSFDDFVKAKALIRNRRGEPDPIEKYNGRKCYKTCLKAYWESGLFKRQFDRFVDTFPFIAETGTIHVDNFQCYTNYAPYVGIKEMQDARRKMVEYAKSKGIDITSEFTYKEGKGLPNKPFLGLPRNHSWNNKMDTVGYIPMSWWCCRMTKKDLLDYPVTVYCGGEFREKKYNNLLYGNMHGEDIVKNDNPNWAQDFINRFATYQVPYHFLNTLDRLAIDGAGSNLVCKFSGNIVSYSKGKKITKNGKIIKDDGNLFLPFVHRDSAYIAYSRNGDCRDWDIFETGKTAAEVYKITESGNEFVRELPIKNGKLHINLPEQVAYLIVLK